jgi:hypothetical protein
LTMRPKRDNVCPKCKAPVEPNYLFCLACGEELPAPAEGARPPEPVERLRKDDSKHTCWQCHARLDNLSPTCPTCGADLISLREQSKPSKRKKQPKQEKIEPAHAPKRRSWLRVATLLLLFVVLGGAGWVMLAPKDGSTEVGGFSLPTLSDIQIPRIFGDDDVSAGEKPEGVAPDATEARVVSVADDGLIRLRIDGQQIDVFLAGTSPSFVTQCLGDKALARVRRILVDESIVFVALDGTGAVNPSPKVATQSVYLWQFDPGTGKVRFANQELLRSGEVAYAKVKLKDSEPGKALIAANERAKAKERGQYEPGACE